jgi:hypothetical protein
VLNVLVLAGAVRPVYWPPARQEFSARVKDLTLPGMEGLTSHGQRLVLSGLRPHATLRLDEESRAYAFLELSLAGPCPGRETRGTLTVEVQARARSRRAAVGFEWRADGNPHRVLVPLFGRDAPQLPVSTLRIEPYADWRTARQCRGGHVELSGPRLTGGLDEPEALR